MYSDGAIRECNPAISSPLVAAYYVVIWSRFSYDDIDLLNRVKVQLG